MLPLFQVHQSGSDVRQNGFENGSLPMREEEGVAQTFPSQETQTGHSARTRKPDSQDREKRRGDQTHPAVKLWRDTFKLNLKLGFKNDIVLTVTDLKAWESLLTEWKAKKWNPLSIKEQLSEYERRATKRTNGTNAVDGQHSKRESVSQHRAPGVPERRIIELPRVQQDSRTDPRSSNRTLEDIVAQAVRRAQRTATAK